MHHFFLTYAYFMCFFNNGKECWCFLLGEVVVSGELKCVEVQVHYNTSLQVVFVIIQVKHICQHSVTDSPPIITGSSPFFTQIQHQYYTIQYNTIQYFYFHKNGPTWGMTRTLTTSQYNIKIIRHYCTKIYITYLRCIYINRGPDTAPWKPVLL